MRAYNISITRIRYLNIIRLYLNDILFEEKKIGRVYFVALHRQ